MGKFFSFKQSASSRSDVRQSDAHDSRRRQRPGNRIAKRTGEFLNKKIAIFSMQKANPSLQPCLAHSSLPLSPEQDHLAHEIFCRDLENQLHADNLLHNVIPMPRTWKDSLSTEQTHMMCLSPRQLRYQELIYEIVRTEKSYISDLTLVYKIFAKDALVWEELPQSIRLIFENLAQIISLHQYIVNDLQYQQQREHPIIKNIVPCFRNYVHLMDKYCAYFVNFELANEDIASSIASKTSLLGLYLQNRTAWPECRSLTLQSFLLKPVQRLMKYPLFFKSLAECLDNGDPTLTDHLDFLQILDSSIRDIEHEKKAAEDFRKLEDLASRIRGLNICLPKQGRRLIHHGHLTLLTSSSQTTFVKSIVSDAAGQLECEYVPHQSFSQKRNNGKLSLSQSRKRVNAYVFLFNDLILCTSIRSKSRPDATPPKASNGFYGPGPGTLFKMLEEPGQLTFIDNTVACQVKGSADVPTSSLTSKRSSLRFTSLRKHRISNDTSKSHFKVEPTQFICSIASKCIRNLRFATKTEEEKRQWCEMLEGALAEHVQRRYSYDTDLTKNSDAGETATPPSLSLPTTPPAAINDGIEHDKDGYGLSLYQSDSENAPAALAGSTVTLIPLLPSIGTIPEEEDEEDDYGSEDEEEENGEDDDDEEIVRYHANAIPPSQLQCRQQEESMELDQEPRLNFDWTPSEWRPQDDSMSTFSDDSSDDGFATALTSPVLMTEGKQRRQYISWSERLVRGIQEERGLSTAGPWSVRIESVREPNRK